MILVTLGTHELSFARLLNEIERVRKAGFIHDEIIVQSGHTPFESDFLTIKPFIKFDEMEQLVNKADLVITHAGVGSIVSAVKKGKKVIAAARLKKFNEHNDNHQLEIVEEFVNSGYILSWGENDDLSEVLKKAADFEPKRFVSGKKNIINIITHFIEEKV
ncbi:PssE/Cps14G family polysaccharide biosynthesis glycosyltransferase [Bacillus rubiinfantis]|uniref:PssE/Cps14G family polysaccharide biosynthesis glycosyltransferase n=1 Tax=Bacillus rubiinfantis TaxID=1499680 RepID=UPI0005A8A8C0|nr:PssE/Cps14G family polysaccharide biosynthesis glycosyltransferase [Bacillus rubiinfantis]